jgi:hypothetical protein
LVLFKGIKEWALRNEVVERNITHEVEDDLGIHGMRLVHNV